MIDEYLEAAVDNPRFSAPESERLLQDGRRTFEEGRTEEAIGIFRRLVKAEPTSDYAYRVLAWALGTWVSQRSEANRGAGNDGPPQITPEERKVHKQAIAALRKAVCLNEKNSWASVPLNYHFYCLQQYDQVISNSEAALVLNPKDAAILRQLGEACFSLGRFAEALEHYKASFRLKADVETQERLAWSLSRLAIEEEKAACGSRHDSCCCAPKVPAAEQKLHKQAIAAFRKALRLNSTNPRMYSDLSYHFYRLHQFQDAIKSSEAALALNPKDAYSLRLLGDAYFWLGRFAKAAEHYRAALKLRPDARTYEWLGTTYLGLGKKAEADKLYRKAASAFPTNAQFIRQLYFASMRRGCYDEALELATRVCNAEPHDYAAHIARGSVLIKLDRTSDAIAAFRQAHSLAPCLFPTVNALLEVWFREKNWVEVDSLLAKAVHDITDPLDRTFLAYYFLKRKDYQAACELLEQACRQKIRLSSFHVDYAKTLRTLGRNNEARQAMEDALQTIEREAAMLRKGIKGRDRISKYHRRRLIDSLAGGVEASVFLGNRTKALGYVKRVRAIDPRSAQRLMKKVPKK